MDKDDAQEVTSLMVTPTVFFDTSIWKYSFDRPPRLLPYHGKIEWAGKEIEFDNGCCFFTLLPNVKLDEKMSKEVGLLRHIADLGRTEKIKLMTSIAVFEEYWSIPGSFGNGPSCFDDVPIDHIGPPFKHSRPIGGKKELISFLKRVNVKRFKELQIVCGAYQGENQINENQLIDAYHIFVAEANNVDYFLTCDKKLIRLLQNQNKRAPNINIVLPSTLIAQLEQQGICCI